MESGFSAEDAEEDGIRYAKIWEPSIMAVIKLANIRPNGGSPDVDGSAAPAP